jgi:hypothetical protein
MRIEPGAPRYRLEPMPAGVRAAIPAQRNWFVTLFIMAWLGGWTFGEIAVGGHILRLLGHPPSSVQNGAPALFLIFWMVGWTLGGLWALTMLAWQLVGREEVRIESGALGLRVAVGPIGRTREFDLLQVRRLRAAPVVLPRNRRAMVPPLFGSRDGSVAFDYGARTYRFGSGLDEAEAAALVKDLTPMLPRSAVAQG